MSQLIINPSRFGVAAPFSVETGHFTKETSGVNGTLQIVPTGFRPKALKIWGNNFSIVTDETTPNADSGFSHGFSDGTNHRCSTGSIDHDNAVGTSRQMIRNDSVYIEYSVAGVVQARCSVAFNGTDFTLTWDIASTTGLVIHYMIWGGNDITDVEVGDFTNRTTVGSLSVATNVANADVLLLISAEQVTTLNVNANGWSYCFGTATSSTKQWACASTVRNGGAGSSHGTGFLSTEIITIPQHGNMNNDRIRADLTAFTASGFDLNYDKASAASHNIFLTMKGGQWESGNGTAKITTTGNKSFTTAFQPQGLVIAQNINTTEDAAAQSNIVGNVSAASSTILEELAGLFGESGVPEEDIGIMQSITDMFRMTDMAGTVLSEAELDGFNATDFTLNFTTVDANTYKIGWLVCRENA